MFQFSHVILKFIKSFFLPSNSPIISLFLTIKKFCQKGHHIYEQIIILCFNYLFNKIPCVCHHQMILFSDGSGSKPGTFLRLIHFGDRLFEEVNKPRSVIYSKAWNWPITKKIILKFVTPLGISWNNRIPPPNKSKSCYSYSISIIH